MRKQEEEEEDTPKTNSCDFFVSLEINERNKSNIL